MKFKQEFVLREVAGENIVIPLTGLGERFNGLITLNETGAFIWKQIEAEKNKDAIVDALLEEYDVTRQQAQRNVDDLCAQMEQLGIL